MDVSVVTGKPELVVLGEWLPSYCEVYSAYACSSVTWHRSKKPKEGLRLVGDLADLEFFDFITHMALNDWTPPGSLTRLWVGLRGRARESVVHLGAMHSLEHLILEGAHVDGLSGLSRLEALELERSTWPRGPVSLPRLRQLALKRVDPIDLRDWVHPGLVQLSVDDADVSHWDALAGAPDLERLYFNGTRDRLRTMGDLPRLVNLRVLSCHEVIASGQIGASDYPCLEYGGLSGQIAQIPEGWSRDSEGRVGNGGRVSS